MAPAGLSGTEDPRPRTPARIAHALALLSFLVVVVLTNGWNDWNLPRLFIIGGFCAASTLTEAMASSKMRVSGSFLGIVLTTVLLGGGPGAVLGVFSELFSQSRAPVARHYLRNNLLTYAWFPLASGLFFHAVTHLTHASVNSLLYYLWVFAAFLLALALNFLAVAGFQCHLDGSSLKDKVREALVPLLSAELFSAVLTMATVSIAVKVGIKGLVLFGLVLIVFQYLMAELLRSKHRAQALHRKATIDDLTGLINRDSLHEEIQARLAPAEEEPEPFALMLLDLDRFKEINDTLGHTYGDEILRTVADRLKRAAGPEGVVARLGGDEFCVLTARQLTDQAELERLAMTLIADMQQPVATEELTLEVGASVGIARFPEDGHDAETLLRRADIAMYAAKDSHTGCMTFTRELDQQSAKRLSVLSDFRRALDGGELIVHYQPIVDVPSTSLSGAEALVRWQHPKHGFIPPAEFIETLEQSRLIGPLTRHVLENAISQCVSWRRVIPTAAVAVNLSVRNLLDRALPTEVAQLLSTYGLPPHALQLEITESAIMADPERSLATISALAELGVRISVDDFGTGYSSLANLRQFPIDELKIDRSFVSPMLHDESDLIIVRSTINLGHDLGLGVVAEGVEDESTLRRLDTMGCDYVQGFHVSRPMSAEDFEAWMAESANIWVPATAARAATSEDTEAGGDRNPVHGGRGHSPLRHTRPALGHGTQLS